MIKTTERCDTQEKLVSALETVNTVTILNKDQFLGINQPDFSDFCRTLSIEIDDIEYKITWFHNYSSIKSKFMESSFDSVVLNKPTWPTEFGCKLQLQLMRADKLAVLI
ncbi:hypothetical protein vBVhaSMAG7_011 [Vibrio phage vB_VhaS_MAG7]|nr:hypothetical protein vBVhaSMAG7_011 [Vibrio phage vB_VhaS_MAG7]